MQSKTTLSSYSGQSVSRRPKKHLGQHFLTAPAYARRIAGAIPAQKQDTILEIGPGTGALTIHLRERFDNLHCIEKDPDVLPRLLERLNGAEITIHNQDAVAFDYTGFGPGIHVAGNLPYSVGARIIKSVLLAAHSVSSCTFMVQREVAERICAAPNGRTRGFLSVFCQYFGSPRLLFHVPPGAFFPRPNVESSVFQLITDPVALSRLQREDWVAFFRLVDKGFSQRRKKLVRVLAGGARSELLDRAFELIGIAQMARAENLSIEQWVALFREGAR